MVVVVVGGGGGDSPGVTSLSAEAILPQMYE